MFARPLLNDFLPPEIQRLSSDSYDRLHWQAKQRRGDAAWLVPMAIGFGAGVGWMFIASFMRTIVLAASKSSPMPLTGPLSNGASWVALNLVVAGLLTLAISVLVRHMMIMRSIRLLLNRAGCPYCDFSLYGLPISPTNSVVCPECGSEVFLHEHRIQREDVEPPKAFGGAGPRGAYRDFEGGDRSTERRDRRRQRKSA